MNTKTKPKNNAVIKNILIYSAALILINVACYALVYYYKVFYFYGQFPIPHIPPNALTLLFMGVANTLFIAFVVMNKCIKRFENKAAFAIFIIGLLYVFISPPLQVPDESDHFLRAVSLSYGNFDFDANRTYPDEINATMHAFNGAFANTNDGYALKVRTDSESDNVLPQQTKDGTGVIYQYLQYYEITNNSEMLSAVPKYTEPILFIVIQFIPQVIGAFVARLIGFGGLGMLYGARIAALLFYTIICRAAIKNCARYKALFFCFAALPLTMYIAASASYDSSTLALYLFVASYLCKDEINNKDAVLFLLAVIFMATLKINNLMWILILFIMPKHVFKTKFNKYFISIVSVVGFYIAYMLIGVYNSFAINGYGEIARAFEEVSISGQFSFVINNFPATIMRFWGTLYENEFFISKLGVLGTLDVPISMLNILSPLIILFCAVLCIKEKHIFTNKSISLIITFCIIYVGSVLIGIYITYTPVGMVRIIGLQARYFMPVYLLLLIVFCSFISRIFFTKHTIENEIETFGENAVKAQNDKALNLAFYAAVLFSILGALLLFETYFVGPVAIVPYVS